MNKFARRILRQNIARQQEQEEEVLINDYEDDDQQSDRAASVTTDATDISDDGNITALSALSNWRLEVIYSLDSSMLTNYWNLIDMLLNIAFICSYITLTWLSIGPRETPIAPAPPPHIYQDIDFALGVILLLQWIPRVVFSLSPINELQSMFAVSTILSCFSAILVWLNITKIPGTFLEGGGIVFLYPFRFWRLNGAISMCFPLGKRGFFAVSPVKQKAVNLGLSIFTTLFLVTAWTHIVLYKVQRYYDLNFLDIFYTISVSSTSGLSTEIIPDNYISRAVTFCIMVVGAIFLPTQLSDLISLMRSTSKYSHSYIPTKGRSHVLVIGNLEIVALRGFLKEFFAADHGAKTLTTTVVIVSPSEPDPYLAELLTDPIYVARVKYIKGSAMSFRSLEKAKVGQAKAAFVLASKISNVNSVEEDAKTVMRCVSLRKFHPKLIVYAQILLPRNKVHLEGLADYVLCIDEFRLGMAAQNCIAPGFTTLLYILTNSISDRAVGDLELYGNNEWMKEYLAGAMMEIYEVQLDEQYFGMNFKDASVEIFKHHRAILFAIGFELAEGEVGSYGSSQRLVFNPYNTTLKGGETGYMITNKSRNARRVGKYNFNGSPSDDAAFWTSTEVESYLKPSINPIPSRKHSNTIDEPRGSIESLTSRSQSGSHKKNISSDFRVINQMPRRESQNVEIESPMLEDKEGDDKIVKMKNSVPTHLDDHVVFCCLSTAFPSNLVYFVAPYRQRATHPIVILCSSAPEGEDWDILAEYPDVYFVLGSALLRRDLRRCLISRASRTIVLADPYLQSITDRTADAAALLALLNIQAMCGADSSNFITIEFTHSQNMKLIGNYQHSMKKAAISDVTELDSQNIVPAFEGGHVFASTMFHSILCQAYYEHNLLALLKIFLFDMESDTQAQPRSSLFQLKLPESYIGMPFGTVYISLITRYNCIAIGLYREAQEEGKSFEYVMLNPSSRCKIRQNDHVFSIGPKPPILT